MLDYYNFFCVECNVTLPWTFTRQTRVNYSSSTCRVYLYILYFSKKTVILATTAATNIFWTCTLFLASFLQILQILNFFLHNVCLDRHFTYYIKEARGNNRDQNVLVSQTMILECNLSHFTDKIFWKMVRILQRQRWNWSVCSII